MKRIIFTLSFIIIMQTLFAADFIVDGIKYTTTGTTTVAVSANSYTGNITIPSTVVNSGTTYSVASIGSSAFSGCTGLTSITIPASVTSIGSYAFYNCKGLTSFTIPSAVTSIGNDAFLNCTGLTSITIPASVTSIGYEAFQNCSKLVTLNYNANNCTFNGSYNGAFSGTALTQVNFGNNVIKIPDYILREVTSLNDFTIPPTITAIGSSAFSGCTGLTSITIPASVTSIGSYAFYNCKGLTSFTIPSAVTSIGNDAFLNCTGLTSITIPASVTSIGYEAFQNCSKLVTLNYNANSCTFNGSYNGAFSGTALTQVNFGNNVIKIPDYILREVTSLNDFTIPPTITAIGSSAFSGCTGLTSITIPASVTSIGSYAFYNCKGLTSFTIPSAVTSIGNDAFLNCTGLTSITIPASVTSIGYEAFQNCSKLVTLNYNANSCTFNGSYNGAFSGTALTQVNFGNNVIKIPDYILREVTSLNDFTIPPTITAIGSSAFSGCTGLTSITIPASVTSIGSYAFYNCKGLTSFTIPSAVTSIGNDAFLNCTGLTSITIPASVTSIGYEAFQNCSKLVTLSYNANSCTFNGSYNGAFSGTALTQVNFGNNVIKIPDYILREVTSLNDFTIPPTITAIGSSAFSGCTGLTSITIPASVTSIGSYAFYNCKGLTSFTIPSAVTSIGSYAFSGCTGLKIIDIKKLIPINLSSSSNVFYNIDKSTCMLYVPIGSASLYTAAIQWKDFSNIIESTKTGFYDISPDSVVSNVKYTDIKVLAYPINFTTRIKLVSTNDTIVPDSVLSRSNTSLTARFSWIGKKGGIYDVLLISDTITLKKEKAFTLIKVTDPEEPLDTDNDGYRNVSTFANLAWIFENNISQSFKYELDNDIDASESAKWYTGKGFNSLSNFSGIIDGHGHSIKHLAFNRSTQDSVAIVKKLSSGGIIRNIKFINTSIFGKNYTSCIASSNLGTILNCSCSGTISGYNNVGGITGINSGTIKCCSNSALITGYEYVGGIAGYSSNISSILRSYNIGKVVSKYICVGGIIGVNYGKISDTFNSGSIIGSGEVGGITGSNLGTITNVYNRGLVNGAGNAIGAIIGYNPGGNTPQNSYSDKETSGGTTSQYGVDGTKKTTTEMKTQSTYTNWDFANTWEIINTMNEGYPEFKWSNNPNRIKSYTPDRTANVDSCTITFEGSGFNDSTKVFLSKAGQTTIKADTLNYNDTYCTARFNLKNAALGTWNISVQYPDTTITIQNGLTVEEKKQGALKIDILGADKIRTGRTATVTVRVTNTGNTSVENPFILIAIDSKDIAFTAHSVNSIVADSIIYNFKKMGLNIKDFSFLRAENLLGHEDRMCKLGIFVFPTISSYGSYDFPIEISSKGDVSISAWQQENYSINDFLGSLKNNTPSQKIKSSNTDYNCISTAGSCLSNIIGTTLKLPIGFTSSVSSGFFVMDQTATIQGKRPDSYTKDIGMLMWGTAGSIAFTVGLATGVSEVLIAGAIVSGVVMGMQCADAVKTCMPDVTSKFNIQAVSSFDPNDKIGYRSPSGSRYFKDDNTNFTYEIDFENKSTATAAAQEVVVTDTLDLGKFNIESFRAGSIKIGKSTYSASYNVQENKWQIDMRPEKNLITNVTLTLDKVKGIAKWDFKSVDPLTMDWPQDVTLGFLPPNDSIGSGQGSVSFTIDLKTGLASDISVKNKATIVFDTNAPIITPTWENTKDIIAPVSNMKQPEVVNDSIITLKWLGEDNRNGSGVYQYNVYVKKAGDTYAALLTNTSQNSIDFKFIKETQYNFYVTAKDSAGNEEIKTNVPDITFKANSFNVSISRKWDDVLVCNNIEKLFSSYQWYKNDVAVTGETKQYYQEMGGLNGSYYVKVITTDGKLGISNTINASTSAKSIKAYPNPAADNQSFRLEIKAAETELKQAKLTISTLSGQVVLQNSNIQSQMLLNGLPKGCYIIHVRLTNREQLNEKLMIN